MELRRLAWLALALLAVAGLWRVTHHPAVKDWWADQHHKPVPFQFDNGTVREYQPASAPTEQAQALPPGTMRRCKRGTETSYANSACPPGSKEFPMSGGTLSVVTLGGPQPAAAAASAAKPVLREVIDPHEAAELRERQLNRAIYGESARH
jgi:hypothetical protein